MSGLEPVADADGIRITRVDWDDPRATALRAEQRAELDAVYGRDDSEPGPAPTAADMTLFLLAEVDGGPAGCGGLRRIDDHHGEIKRMYVAPGHRGTGLAARILHELEDEATMLGWSRLVLETGDLQVEAVRFYAREGYERIPLYGYYVDSDLSICFGRELAPRS